MFANKDKFLHRNCKRNCSMCFKITPSPVTQSYRLYTTGENNKCINKMFWGKCGTAQKACVTGGFCLSSATMSGARSLDFTSVFAPDLLHICLSRTQPFLSRHATLLPFGEECCVTSVFLSSRSTPPQRGREVGEGGVLLTRQKRLCLSWDKSEATLVKGLLIPVVSHNLSLVLRGMSWEGGKRRAPAVRVTQRRLGTSQSHRWNVELRMWRTQY